MAMIKLGRNNLRWCPNPSCNMLVMDSKTCPVCGAETFETAITPPADARPAFPSDIERVRGLCDAAFGEGTGRLLLPEGHVAVMNKAPSIDRMEEVLCDGVVVCVIRYDLGAGWHIVIRMQGAMRISRAMTKGFVIVDPAAVQYIRENKNMMAPGVEDADRGIAPEDEVVMLTPDRSAVGTGIAKMSGEDMVREDHGLAVKTRKHKAEEPVAPEAGRTWDEVVAANSETIGKRRDEAIGFIRSTRARNDLPAIVSFSGGKDSLAVMLLVMESGEEGIRPMFIDTGLELQETVDYVHAFAEGNGLDLITAEPPEDAFWGNLVYFGPPAKDFRWCCKTNKLGPTTAAITRNFPDGVLSFIGQRKYESEARHSKPRVWRNPWTVGQIGAAPIQNWSAMHVWLYIFSRMSEDPRITYNGWYARGLDRIGCFMCPASDMADHGLVSECSRYPRWEEYLEGYARDNGLPEEYVKYGLWRWKNVPGSVKESIERATGRKVPEMRIEKTFGEDDGPVAVRFQQGYSPCTLGFSTEGAASRPIDLERLEPFAKAMGDRVALDRGSDVLTADDVSFYGAGSIIVKARDEDAAGKLVSEAEQIIARAFNCVGCSLCAARCPSGALSMESGRVSADASACTSCGLCFGSCPAVDFSPASRSRSEEEREGFESRRGRKTQTSGFLRARNVARTRARTHKVIYRTPDGRPSWNTIRRTSRRCSTATRP